MKSTTFDFNKTYNEMYSRVLQFVSLRISDYEIARDIVSDVFVKVYEKQGTFDPSKSSVSTWVWTIVKNHLTDHFRRKKLDEIKISQLLSDETGEEINIKGSSDTFKSVSGQEQMKIIIDAVNALPDAYRQIADLAIIQDLKLADVVTETGKPLNTVKVMVMRAKTMLANKLQYLA